MRPFYLGLVLLAVVPALADTHKNDKEVSAAMLTEEAKKGVELPTPTVNGSVGITAVLLTQGSVRRLFGKEIANTYAVVQLTISNRNPDAAFVLHSAYIDTSQWALGGGTGGFRDTNATPEPERSGSHSHRIDSAESRIARGQLLDAQMWSARNWTIRILTVLGSVASGYSFAFKETGIAKGIAAFNGNIVPGVAFAWPDGAVAQQNRISDFGYQTNKIIAKQSSDIIVCFFPIDMFLSSPFRDLFLKSPGLFLSPYQILFTEKNAPYLQQLGLSTTPEALRKLHPCYSKVFEASAPARKTSKDEMDSAKGKDGSSKNLPDAKKNEPGPVSNPPENVAHESLQDIVEAKIVEKCAKDLNEEQNRQALVDLDYIGRFGLQNIGIYIDGIMTVDVDIVPGSIDQVTFEGDSSKADFWASLGEKKGTVQCRFCQDGQISIIDGDKIGITDVTTIGQGSDDHQIKFSFKITKPIETGQSLTFLITKKPADPKKSGHEVKSAPFVYQVGFTQSGPTITKVTIEDKKITVTGTGFVNTKLNPLTVSLTSDGPDKPVSLKLPDTIAADKLVLDVPSGLAPGCWSVKVEVGTMAAPPTDKPQPKVLSPATPELTSATRKDGSIAIKGTQLVDTSGCGGKAIKLQLLKAGDTKPVDVTAKLASGTDATLTLPPQAKAGDWSVQVLQGSDVKSTIKIK